MRRCGRPRPRAGSPPAARGRTRGSRRSRTAARRRARERRDRAAAAGDRQHDQRHRPGADPHVEGVGAGRDPDRGRREDQERRGAARGRLAGDRAGGDQRPPPGRTRRRAMISAAAGPAPPSPTRSRPKRIRTIARRMAADVGRVGVDPVDEVRQELAGRVDERDDGQVLVGRQRVGDAGRAVVSASASGQAAAASADADQQAAASSGAEPGAGPSRRSRRRPRARRSPRPIRSQSPGAEERRCVEEELRAAVEQQAPQMPAPTISAAQAPTASVLGGGRGEPSERVAPAAASEIAVPSRTASRRMLTNCETRNRAVRGACQRSARWST